MIITTDDNASHESYAIILQLLLYVDKFFALNFFPVSYTVIIIILNVWLKYEKCAAIFENKLTRELMVCEGDTLINVQFLRKYSAGVDSVCCSKN